MMETKGVVRFGEVLPGAERRRKKEERCFCLRLLSVSDVLVITQFIISCIKRGDSNNEGG